MGFGLLASLPRRSIQATARPETTGGASLLGGGSLPPSWTAAGKSAESWRLAVTSQRPFRPFGGLFARAGGNSSLGRSPPPPPSFPGDVFNGSHRAGGRAFSGRGSCRPLSLFLPPWHCHRCCCSRSSCYCRLLLLLLLPSLRRRRAPLPHPAVPQRLSEARSPPVTFF